MVDWVWLIVAYFGGVLTVLGIWAVWLLRMRIWE